MIIKCLLLALINTMLQQELQKSIILNDITNTFLKYKNDLENDIKLCNKLCLINNSICLSSNILKLVKYLNDYSEENMKNLDKFISNDNNISSDLIVDYNTIRKVQLSSINIDKVREDLVLQCFCKYGFSSSPISYDNIEIKYCNYPQKLYLFAFVIETVVGFGIGHLYVGRIIHGTIKFTFSFIIWIIIQSLAIVKTQLQEEENQNVNNTLKQGVSYLFYTLRSLIYLWQLIDGLLFYCLYYKDGHGISLY